MSLQVLTLHRGGLWQPDASQKAPLEGFTTQVGDVRRILVETTEAAAPSGEGNAPAPAPGPSGDGTVVLIPQGERVSNPAVVKKSSFPTNV